MIAIKDMKDKADKTDKALASVDALLKNSHELITTVRALRLGLTLRKYFPEVVKAGGKFFVVEKGEYLSKSTSSFSEFSPQSNFHIKGLRRSRKPRHKMTDEEKISLKNIIICDLQSPHNDRDFVEVPPFEIPKQEGYVFSIAAGKKNED
jgi:hypothetical protein